MAEKEDILNLAANGAMTAAGGYAQAALGGVQAIYGLSQLPKAKAAFESAKASAPSLETPSQFYENYRNAYDSEIARMETDAIQTNLATSVQALQGAGGRALVGGLSGATRTAQDAQNRMLSQERAMRLQAGQQLAAAEERSIGRKEARSQQEMAYANQAYQAALGNVAGGIGSAAEGLMYAVPNTDWDKVGKGLKDAGEKTGAALKDAGQAVGSGVSKAAQKVGEKASALKERVEYGMDVLPEKINDFKNQRAIKNRLKSTKANRQQAVSLPEAGSSMSMPMVNPFEGYKPPTPQAPPPNVRQTAPVTGSAIPQYQQNEAVMNDIKQDSDLYNMVSPYLSGTKQITPAQKGWMKWYDKFGSYIPMMENGGMVTPGEFSHDSNPIDLVQNGQKVGEATGGEYVLNPKQAASIAKQSTYARKLFKKFEKNAKK